MAEAPLVRDVGSNIMCQPALKYYPVETVRPGERQAEVGHRRLQVLLTY